jgi:hypothetical protein
MNPNMDSRAVDTLRDANRILEANEFKRWQFPAYILIWCVEFAVCLWVGFKIFGS